MNCCKVFEQAIKEGVLFHIINDIAMRTCNKKHQIIEYALSYCPFCGKQLVIDELELIKE